MWEWDWSVSGSWQRQRLFVFCEAAGVFLSLDLCCPLGETEAPERKDLSGQVWKDLRSEGHV